MSLHVKRVVVDYIVPLDATDDPVSATKAIRFKQHFPGELTNITKINLVAWTLQRVGDYTGTGIDDEAIKWSVGYPMDPYWVLKIMPGGGKFAAETEVDDETVQGFPLWLTQAGLNAVVLDRPFSVFDDYSGPISIDNMHFEIARPPLPRAAPSGYVTERASRPYPIFGRVTLLFEMYSISTSKTATANRNAARDVPAYKQIVDKFIPDSNADEHDFESGHEKDDLTRLLKTARANAWKERS